MTRWLSIGKHRRYLYRLANAGVGVFVVWHMMTGDQAAALGILLNATLGLADANVSVEDNPTK